MDPLAVLLHEIRNLQQYCRAGVGPWYEEAVVDIVTAGAVRPCRTVAVEGAEVAAAVDARWCAPGQTGPLALDRAAVLQVVANLTQNAERHGGGCVDRELSLVESSHGRYVEVRVSDRGGRAAIAGNGQGLGVCRALTARHGGWFEPRTEQRPTARAVFRDGGGHVAPVSCTVLCVEDNTLNRRILGQMIHRAGASTVLTGSVGSALGALEGRHYPIACVDRHLPDGDGLDLARTLQAAVGRVIIMSGDAPDPTWSGPWLVKPVSERAVAGALFADLQRRRAPSDTVIGVANRILAGRDLTGDGALAEYLAAVAALDQFAVSPEQRELHLLARRLADGETVAHADVAAALHWQILGSRVE